VGSPDFINQGNQLVLVDNHAVPGASGPTSLNFTGPSISGGQAYVSLYDTTPGDGAATKDLFDASAPGGFTISQDVLFVKHNASAGTGTMLHQGAVESGAGRHHRARQREHQPAGQRGRQRDQLQRASRRDTRTCVAVAARLGYSGSGPFARRKKQ